MNPIRSIFRSLVTVKTAMVPLALLGATSLSHAATSANLLVDSGFETQVSMSGYASVVSNFTTTTGIWATENGVFIGADGGVNPQGTRMLKMVNSGGVTTSTIQMISLAAFSAEIAAGNASFSMRALFNTSATSGTPSAGIVTEFFAGAGDWGSPIGSAFSTSKFLDTNPGTWESIVSGGSIPLGAGWAAVQVVFGDANLGSESGYVDGNSDTSSFTVQTIPEPSGVMLLGLGVSVFLLRRRK